MRRRAAGRRSSFTAGQLDRPADCTNPVTASMNVVLPAPLGPIRPITWPSSTPGSTPTTALDAAEADRDAGRREIPCSFRASLPGLTMFPRPQGQGPWRRRPGAAALAAALARRFQYAVPAMPSGLPDQRDEVGSSAPISSAPVAGQAEPPAGRACGSRPPVCAEAGEQGPVIIVMPSEVGVGDPDHLQ